MRSIQSVIITELQKREFRVFYLLDIEIDSVHYRYTDCDIPIIFDGNVYDPRGFEVESIGYSMDRIVDQFSFSIDNIDNILTPAFIGGTPRGGTVILSIVAMDLNYNIVSQEVPPTVYTCYWEEDVGTEGLEPIEYVGETLGLWEQDLTTGGIQPISGIATDEEWEHDVGTGGVMPIN